VLYVSGRHKWERLKETKVDAYLKVVAKRIGLLPTPQIYDEFYIGKDGRMLYLKNGTRVTYLNDSTKYQTLKSIASADYIRTHLFPYYMTGQQGRTLQPPQRKSLVSIKALPPRPRSKTLSRVIYHNMHLTSTLLLSNYSQSLELTPTDSPYEIYLDWTRLYIVIVVHSLIISRNYTNWTPTLPMQNIN